MSNFSNELKSGLIETLNKTNEHDMLLLYQSYLKPQLVSQSKENKSLFFDVIQNINHETDILVNIYKLETSNLLRTSLLAKFTLTKPFVTNKIKKNLDTQYLQLMTLLKTQMVEVIRNQNRDNDLLILLKKMVEIRNSNTKLSLDYRIGLMRDDGLC
jgi:hypothetical protein